jgi:hypothetical protein
MLPPNKNYIKPCRREALLLHPGGITKQRSRVDAEFFGCETGFGVVDAVRFGNREYHS